MSNSMLLHFPAAATYYLYSSIFILQLFTFPAWISNLRRKRKANFFCLTESPNSIIDCAPCAWTFKEFLQILDGVGCFSAACRGSQDSLESEHSSLGFFWIGNSWGRPLEIMRKPSFLFQKYQLWWDRKLTHSGKDPLEINLGFFTVWDMLLWIYFGCSLSWN